MELHKRNSSLAGRLRGVVSTWLAVAAPFAHASTVWTGSLITYTQPPLPADGIPLAAQADHLTSRVWLTRASRDRMYNLVSESFCTRGVSPADTEWASGTLANHASLSYHDFSTWVDSLGGGNVNPKILNVSAVVHLKTDDIYLSIKFTAWAMHDVGGYSYQRSTPAPVAPTVSLTNPAPGAVYAAPANVKIGAAAAVSAGSVTNVAFFGNTTLLGSVQTAPFNLTANNLAAGAYALTAVATAAGVSATSAVVNISVVSPVAVSNSVPAIANGRLSFTYSANVGLSYVVQDSSNLVQWLPLVTNVAASTQAQATDTFIPGSLRFYRVVRQPNP